MTFKLPYHIVNGGDGSAILAPKPTLAEAEKADEDQSEGWGECSADTIELKVENNKLFFKGFPDDGSFRQTWIEVKEA